MSTDAVRHQVAVPHSGGIAGMALIASVHLAYWVSGTLLALHAGLIPSSGAVAIALWLTLLALWGLVVRRISLSGWLSGPALPTRPGVWLPASTVILTATASMAAPLLWSALVAATMTLPPTAALWLHAFRLLALGTVLKARRREIPRIIGYGVGGADAVFGAVSLGLAISGGFETMPIWLPIAWHLSGALILLSMLPLLSLCLPSIAAAPWRAGDARALLQYPLVLAPAALATLFLIQHAASLGSKPNQPLESG
jgi:hypothetical protein